MEILWHFIVEKINNEEVFEIITDKSPFYAEKGGQVGDKGTGISKTGEFNIIDTISPYGGIFVHKSKMKSGEITKNSTIKLIVEEERREKKSSKGNEKLAGLPARLRVIYIFFYCFSV